MQMQVNWLPIAAVGLVIVIVGMILFLPLGEQKPSRSPSDSSTDPVQVQGAVQHQDENAALDAQAPQEAVSPETAQDSETPVQSTPSGLALQADELAVDDGEGEPSIIPENAQPGSLTVVVLDINDLPLPGARVRVGENFEGGVGYRGDLHIESPPDPPFIIEGSHLGYESQSRTVTQEELDATQLVTLRLIPQNALTGRVLDNFGNAIQGAEVRANAQTGIWVSNVRTDRNGVFRFNSPPQATVRIQAEMEGYSDEGAGVAMVTPPQSEALVLRLEMPTLAISGQVVKQEDGSGVGSVRIIARQEGGMGAGETVTGPDGFYRIANLPKGSYTVRGENEGNSNVVFIPGDESKQVRLIEWDVRDVNFTVSNAYTVIGKVLLSDGRPVQGAAVSVDRMNSLSGYSASISQGRYAVSIADGSFVLSGVPLPMNAGGFSVRLSALHEVYGIGYSEPLPPASHVHSYEVIIQIEANTATIYGEVVTKQGAAVAEARASITLAGQGGVMQPILAQSNFLGEFTLEGIPAMDGAVHLLTIEKPGFATYVAQLRLTPGEVRHIEIVMDSAGEIGGRVVDQNGTPISGAEVTARSIRHSSRPALTNEQGVYHLDNLAEGVYDVIVHYPGNPPLSGALYQVLVGTMDADITLNRRQWIVSGPVWDAQNDVAIHRYSIGIEGQPSSPRGRPFFERRDFNTPDGHYTLTLTEAGEYRLRFHAEGYEAQERRVRIAPEIPDFQYIGAGLDPIQGEGEIFGTFVPNPGTELAAVQVIGLGAFSVQNNQIHLQGVPTGIHDLLFFIHEIGSGARYPLGVLPSVPVESNGRTELGALGPLNINAYVRDGVLAD